jgi:hypothetical protein
LLVEMNANRNVADNADSLRRRRQGRYCPAGA